MIRSPAGRGRLIVIEGIDGTGKTTLARRLAARLAGTGRPAALLREPSDGPHGRRIREIAAQGRRAEMSPEEELGLFMEDRAENCRERIRPALERGETVVLDRYYLSSAAYQGALGLDPEDILRRNEAFAVLPDLVLLLDLPVSEGLDRIRRKRGTAHDDFEKSDYLEKVRSIFLGIRRPFLRVLDASVGPDELFAAAWREVEEAEPGAAGPGGSAAGQPTKGAER